MERAGYRWTDWTFQSRYLLPLLTLATLLAIVATSTSGCSSRESASDEQNTSAKRELAERSTSPPPGQGTLRLAAYQFEPPLLPIVTEERTFRLPSITESPVHDLAPLPAVPNFDDTRFDGSNFDSPVANTPIIDRLPPVDQGYVSRPGVAIERQPPISELESVEIAQQQSLPSTHVVRGGPGMESVSRRADMYVKKGFELAGRGALYSARAQFIIALRTIADALDAHSATAHHAAALDAGLTALRESDDFHSPNAVTRRRRLEVIVASHRTPILRHLVADESAQDRPPVRVPGRVVAMQRYYTYAQQQLTVSGGREVIASMALYGLGKTCLTLQQSRDPAIIAGGPKAIVLHQAALLVDSRNYMAANEVGVLMAHCGQYYAARRALQHAAANSNNAAVWRNLSIVHEHLGETDLALRARRQVEIALREMTPHKMTPQSGSGNSSNLSGSPQQPVVLLDSSEFAATSKFEADDNANANEKSLNAKPGLKPSASSRPNTPKAAQRRAPSKWLPSFGGTRK